MNLYAIDFETDPFDGTTDIQPFIMDIYDGKTHFTCETVDECHAFIECHRGTYYAHNGGRFDYHLGGFTNPIESGTEILAINGRLAKFNMLGSEFRDSFCILPSRLAEIGGKGEIDYAKMARAVRKDHMPEIIRYLHIDTEVLWHAVKAFRDQYGAGITLASTAIKELAARLPKGKQLPKLKVIDDKIMRCFYYGGRVEAHRKGIIKKPFKVYDIASAYPLAMMKKHCWGNSMDIDDDVSVKEKIADQAFYEIRAISKGSLPKKGKDGSLTFPDSDKSDIFTVTGWEINAGVETETLELLKIIRKITFGDTCDFSAYVKHFYRLKAESPKGSHERLFAKLLLNSAYGKLGANPDNYTRQVVVSEKEMPIYMHADMGYEHHGCIGDKFIVERPLEDFEKKRIHVGAAASITGFVRAKLWREMCRIRQAGGTILYNDTDSLTVQGATVECGEEIGDWTLDGDCTEGAIAGKKLYAFKCRDGAWKISSKGARLDAGQVYQAARGEVVNWSALAPTYSLTKSPRMLTRNIRRT